MLRFIRLIRREPLWIVGVLWPLVLLAPHLPGVPRPAFGGLPWRQELLLAFFLCLTLAFTVKRRWRLNDNEFDFSGLKLSLTISCGLFVVWIWLSSVWAEHPLAAVHLAFQWSAYLVFFALMYLATARPRLLRASLLTLGIVIWILGVACAIESWFGAPLTDGNLRGNAKPVFRGSGSFGEIMAIAVPLFGALALSLRRPRYALLCGATASVAWLATLQAMERAPMIGAIAGLFLLIGGACLWPGARPRRFNRMAMLVAALVIVAVLQTASFGGGAANEASSAISRLQTGLRHDANTSARLLLWGIGLEMWRESPLTGVGGNNYEIAFAEARAKFAASHPSSEFSNINEGLLAVYAHNEYVQILAELGLVGFLLFVCFCVLLVAVFWRALKGKRGAIVAFGAGGGLFSFALSSGASSSSFRNLGGGLVFFFAAALIARIATHDEGTEAASKQRRFQHSKAYVFIRRAATVCSLSLMCAMFCYTTLQASVSVLNATAQSNAHRAEELYQMSLRLNPYHTPTHYSYGMWLYSNGQPGRAVPHLRYATRHGFNSSVCFAYLAEAEQESGDIRAAAETLSYMARVYPSSVFARARYAAALAELGREPEAENEYRAALALDSRQARGWWQLIRYGRDAATAAARSDPSIALPGELSPSECVFAVLSKDDRLPPSVTGQSRALLRSP
jgi:O-antigen ligase